MSFISVDNLSEECNTLRSGKRFRSEVVSKGLGIYITNDKRYAYQIPTISAYGYRGCPEATLNISVNAQPQQCVISRGILFGTSS